MTREEMKKRTKAYATREIKVCESLSNNWVVRTLGAQLLRSGTSVGANYRAVSRAKSTADFLNKLKIVEEECDESIFWTELLVENSFVKAKRLSALMQEGNEIVAIVVAAAKTTTGSSFRPSSGKS
jgi:four helix bundle protein